jgi:hypothetical protein
VIHDRVAVAAVPRLAAAAGPPLAGAPVPLQGLGLRRVLYLVLHLVPAPVLILSSADEFQARAFLSRWFAK